MFIPSSGFGFSTQEQSTEYSSKQSAYTSIIEIEKAIDCTVNFQGLKGFVGFFDLLTAKTNFYEMVIFTEISLVEIIEFRNIFCVHFG